MVHLSMKTRLKNLFRPVLSDEVIVEYIKAGLLFDSILEIENRIQIQPNSVDLRIGNTYKTIAPNALDGDTVLSGQYRYMANVMSVIDPIRPLSYQSGEFKDGKLVIGPGEFVLLASKEVLNIPNGIVAFVQGRSSIARMGIQTEQAGLIDTGFHGTITFEVFNETKYPIVLYEGMRVAQVYFFKAQYAKTLYGAVKNSKYSGQIEATGSNIHKDPELNKYR